MLLREHIPTQSFTNWLFRTRENKMLLIVAFCVIVIQFVWFKILYPYPNFFPDSFEYIAGAIENRTIDYRPIGYSQFLRLFHWFSQSDLLLVWFQYIFLQVSLLYLLFSVGYLLHTNKWTLRILIIACILNPLVPHISNFVSSDPLFTALSLLWLTQLLWIIGRPTQWLLLVHALVLFMAFIVRYNALYYPVISCAIIFFSSARWRLKFISVSFIVLLLGEFVSFTKYQYKKATGIAQFSPFSGWQLVANALVAYSYSKPDDPATVPAEFRALHAVINNYMDSLHRTPHDPVIETSPYYLWGDQSPVLYYMRNVWKSNTKKEFLTWAAISPFYEEYARYLIKKHPWAYVKYHFLTNAYLYFKPSLEYLGVYNVGGKIIDPTAMVWFHYKTREIPVSDTGEYIPVTKYIPAANGFVNCLLVLGFIGFLCIAGFSKCTAHSKNILLCMLLIWLCNTGFSVIAAPVILRYQVFQITITLIGMVLLIGFILKEYQLVSTQQETTSKKRQEPNTRQSKDFSFPNDQKLQEI